MTTPPPFPSRYFLSLAVSGILLLFTPIHKAHAALVFCNEAKETIDIAIGYKEGTTWISEGWWRIEPNLCSRIYRQPLKRQNYFYYATGLVTSATPYPTTWSGPYGFCTSPKAFKIVGHDRCVERGHELTGFTPMPLIAGKKDFIMHFTGNDQGPTPK